MRTAEAVSAGTWSTKRIEPYVVVSPAVSKRSLTATAGPVRAVSGRARKMRSRSRVRATLLREDELPGDSRAAIAGASSEVGAGTVGPVYVPAGGGADVARRVLSTVTEPVTVKSAASTVAVGFGSESRPCVAVAQVFHGMLKLAVVPLTASGIGVLTAEGRRKYGRAPSPVGHETVRESVAS